MSFSRSASMKTRSDKGKFHTFEQQIPRFWRMVDKKGTDECWTWTGVRHKEGYGRFRYDGKFISSHRYSYLLHFGRDSIPEGMQVCHKCDNPPCCNPSHFFLGTKKDNSDDRDIKGRNVNLVGEAHGSAILTELKVIEIRTLAATGGKHRDLAVQFGISKSAVSAIVSRRLWRHVI